jgi:hypothetical protein
VKSRQNLPLDSSPVINKTKREKKGKKKKVDDDDDGEEEYARQHVHTLHHLRRSQLGLLHLGLSCVSSDNAIPKTLPSLGKPLSTSRIENAA